MARSRAPERATLQTCIGCGARDLPRPCTGDCREVRLELVDAGDAAALGAERDVLRAFAPVAAAVLAELERGAPDEVAAAARWPALRDAARAALHEAPPPEADAPAPLAVATTWWCASCGRIEAPQPCIGVCVRRPQEMVAAAPAVAVEAETAALRAATRDQLALLRLLATLRPRAGHVAETWAALGRRSTGP